MYAFQTWLILIMNCHPVVVRLIHCPALSEAALMEAEASACWDDILISQIHSVHHSVHAFIFVNECETH